MLKSIEYKSFIFPAIVLGLAPFVPEPHLVQKFNMLMAGTLNKPLDIFDVFFHSAPTILLVVKFVSEKVTSKK